MDAATRLTFRPALLWGALLVLAWALLTALVGGSSAHAEEDAPTPLDSVGSLLGGTLGQVTSTASEVLEKADAAVSPAVDAVASIPVVGAVVSPVLHETSALATSVSQQVADTAQAAPVTAIVTPVTEVISHVPVVGTVARELGVTAVSDSVAGTLDSTLAATADALATTVPAVVAPIDPGPSVTPPGEPEDPDRGPGELTPPPASDLAPTATVTAESAAALTSAAQGTTTDAAWAPRSGPADASPRHTADATSQPASERLPGAPPAPAPSLSSSAGAGAHGSRSGPDCATVDPHHAPPPAAADAFCARGEALPPSPAQETDCSPD